MARRFSIGGINICFLAIMVVSFVFDAKALAARKYDFFKIAMKWPPSYCNTGQSSCQEPIVVNFTIHGLFPMYNPETIVPPYDEDHGCTDIQPMDEDDIDLDYLESESILDELNMYWMDVVFNNWVEMNLQQWRKQYKKHGKCFDYADHPSYFFNMALAFVRRVNLLLILDYASITPNNEEEAYLARHIRNNISNAGGGKRVQIRCNEDANGFLQLSEVRVCFKPSGVAIDCPHGYAKGLPAQIVIVNKRLSELFARAFDTFSGA
ncbi:extracellular ribonuclease LE-like [Tripterygium wilfordii]|uniref:extracellular ribonuclease LE-like n=1 Tax=Tripterygium wilfordii TaxID=458696 RepID=UPI0018F7E916|nr:extracellular ribonuclease LE-like [Tripterygium wilfordii]